MGIRKGNNVGLVTSTGGGAEDLLHTLPTARPTKVIITKVMWYNALAANVNILLGTYTTAGVFSQVLPTIIAIPGLSGFMEEEELPEIEFVLDTQLAAAGRTGDIYIQDASAGGLQIRLEVEEF